MTMRFNFWKQLAKKALEWMTYSFKFFHSYFQLAVVEHFLLNAKFEAVFLI